MPKIAFATVCTDIYVKYLKVFLKSILIHNPDFNIPFFVTTRIELLTNKNQAELLSIYPNIIFKFVNAETYITNNKGNVRYYSLETFSITGYDKIIYFGCDVLCLGDISELYNIEVENIAMTREKRRNDTFNNNCMIINGDICGDEIYNEMMKIDYTYDTRQYGTDQKLYALHFENRITELDYKWNTLVSEADELDGVKFLHYIYKPDIEMGKKHLHKYLIDLWEEYRSKV